VDKALIESKLESLRRCIRRIASKTPSSGDILRSDLDLQDIIVFNLERAVQSFIKSSMISSDGPVTYSLFDDPAKGRRWLEAR